MGIGNTNPICHLQVNGVANINNGSEFAITNGKMQSGSLTIGGKNADYGGNYYSSGIWTGTNTAGLLMECLNNTEIAIHDTDNRLASLTYYEGSINRISIGRDMGWGAISIVSINGNVGFGITNPYTKVHIKGTDTITALTIMGKGGTNAISQLNLSTYDTTTNLPNCSLIATDMGSYACTFQIKQKTTGADANAQFTSLFIDSSGNVGIGITTNTTQKLYVNGSCYIDGNTTIRPIVNDRNNYDHSTCPLTITNQTISGTTLNDSLPVLNLCRQGFGNVSYGQRATLCLSRFENSYYDSRTRLDFKLASGAYDDVFAMTFRSDGNTYFYPNPQNINNTNGANYAVNLNVACFTTG